MRLTLLASLFLVACLANEAVPTPTAASVVTCAMTPPDRDMGSLAGIRPVWIAFGNVGIPLVVTAADAVDMTVYVAQEVPELSLTIHRLPTQDLVPLHFDGMGPELRLTRERAKPRGSLWYAQLSVPVGEPGCYEARFRGAFGERALRFEVRRP